MVQYIQSCRRALAKAGSTWTRRPFHDDFSILIQIQRQFHCTLIKVVVKWSLWQLCCRGICKILKHYDTLQLSYSPVYDLKYFQGLPFGLFELENLQPDYGLSGPYISMAWTNLQNFNSHVGYKILKSHSPEEIFLASAIRLLLKSNIASYIETNFPSNLNYDGKIIGQMGPGLWTPCHKRHPIPHPNLWAIECCCIFFRIDIVSYNATPVHNMGNQFGSNPPAQHHQGSIRTSSAVYNFAQQF